MTEPLELEENPDHLEEVAALTRVRVQFPQYLLTTDPAFARGLVLNSKRKEEVEVELPAPEVPTREALPGDPVPAGASRMQKKAEANGWTTMVSYGRGPWLGARDAVTQSDVIWLAMERSMERVLATWRDGKFISGRIFSPYDRSFGPNWRKISSPHIVKALEAE